MFPKYTESTLSVTDNTLLLQWIKFHLSHEFQVFAVLNIGGFLQGKLTCWTGLFFHSHKLQL